MNSTNLLISSSTFENWRICISIKRANTHVCCIDSYRINEFSTYLCDDSKRFFTHHAVFSAAKGYLNWSLILREGKKSEKSPTSRVLFFSSKFSFHTRSIFYRTSANFAEAKECRARFFFDRRNTRRSERELVGKVRCKVQRSELHARWITR